MNQNTIAQTSTQLASTSNLQNWIGIGITSLVVLFLIFDAVTKIIRVPGVIDACQKVGIATDLVAPIGILLFACTAIYTNPKTAILGALLLTAYLGGATTIHVIARQGAFPIIFSVTFGLLVWTGLILREPRLLQWILFRR